jgi:elongation factor 2
MARWWWLIALRAVQTETVLRQALQDCFSLESQMEAEEMYSRFCKVIENVNLIIADCNCNDSLMGDVRVQTEKRTVAFGSGLHGWSFTTEQFAMIYAQKMGVQKEKMMQRMWGDSFFNAEKKVWTKEQQPEVALSLCSVHSVSSSWAQSVSICVPS